MGKETRKIPRFRNEQEEAEFWDTHSVTNFLDELEPVELAVKKPLGHILSVRIDSQDFHRLTEMARAEGVGVTTLARMLLKATLKEAQAKPGSQDTLEEIKATLDELARGQKKLLEGVETEASARDR